MKKIISLSLLLTVSAGLSFSNAGVGSALGSSISAANNYLTPWGRGLATYKHFENSVKDLYRYLSFAGKNPTIRNYYFKQALREAGVGLFDAATTAALVYAYAKLAQKGLEVAPSAANSLVQKFSKSDSLKSLIGNDNVWNKLKTTHSTLLDGSKTVQSGMESAGNRVLSLNPFKFDADLGTSAIPSHSGVKTDECANPDFHESFMTRIANGASYAGNSITGIGSSLWNKFPSFRSTTPAPETTK